MTLSMFPDILIHPTPRQQFLYTGVITIFSIFDPSPYKMMALYMGGPLHLLLLHMYFCPACSSHLLFLFYQCEEA